MLAAVYGQGKKWSEYAFELNRTEHSVKNRFNSLIKRQRKLTPGIKKEEKLILEARRELEGRGGEEGPVGSGSESEEGESEEMLGENENENEKVADPTATLIQLEEKEEVEQRVEEQRVEERGEKRREEVL